MGLLGWCVRVLGGLAVLAGLAFVSLLAGVYLFISLPNERFARLSGSARRLAIYDAFAKQIDRHYYDQSFSGFDWPKLRREWRVKAVAEPDDLGLYNGVFAQVTQRFPTSHVAVIAPPPPPELASKWDRVPKSGERGQHALHGGSRHRLAACTVSARKGLCIRCRRSLAGFAGGAGGRNPRLGRNIGPIQ